MTFGFINSTEVFAQQFQAVAQSGDKMNQTSEKVQPCTAPPIDSRIEVDISEQQLYLYCRYAEGNEEKKIYPVSTSKYGIGSKAGSNKTPLGQHRIEKKFGEGAPEGMIFRARRSTGKIAQMNAPDAGDLVTTRIMWLKGLERGINSGRGIDSYKRYIYIHGTAEENKIGSIASHGCIRMYNRDVIDLFGRVTEGVEVNIKR
ncbi:MAG: L,D-transpeptidase [Thiomargarita sp.]|nr:L,D-transpeptidase [Thiomargarita sp.]